MGGPNYLEHHMSERTWTDAGTWNLRHAKPGAMMRESSLGGVETGEEGEVLRVAPRFIENRRLDADAGKLVVELVEVSGAPSRDDLLAAGYLDRALFPLRMSDLDDEEEPPTKKKKTGSKKKTSKKKTSKKAKTTKVASRKRDEAVAPEPGDPDPPAGGRSSGEMGLAPDLSGSGDVGDGGEGVPVAPSYENPFTETGVPAGAKATDPAFNPPEGAPHGGAVRSLIRDGRVEVLDT